MTEDFHIKVNKKLANKFPRVPPILAFDYVKILTEIK